MKIIITPFFYTKYFNAKYAKFFFHILCLEYVEIRKVHKASRTLHKSLRTLRLNSSNLTLRFNLVKLFCKILIIFEYQKIINLNIL